MKIRLAKPYIITNYIFLNFLLFDIFNFFNDNIINKNMMAWLCNNITWMPTAFDSDTIFDTLRKILSNDMMLISNFKNTT